MQSNTSENNYLSPLALLYAADKRALQITEQPRELSELPGEKKKGETGHSDKVRKRDRSLMPAGFVVCREFGGLSLISITKSSPGFSLFRLKHNLLLAAVGQKKATTCSQVG